MNDDEVAAWAKRHAEAFHAWARGARPTAQPDVAHAAAAATSARTSPTSPPNRTSPRPSRQVELDARDEEDEARERSP